MLWNHYTQNLGREYNGVFSCSVRARFARWHVRRQRPCHQLKENCEREYNRKERPRDSFGESHTSQIVKSSEDANKMPVVHLNADVAA